MHIFRKHQKALMWGMFILIGIPMLFFGVPAFWGNNSQNADSPVVASVGGIPITEADLLQALNQAQEQQATSGERPTFRQLVENGTVQRVLEQFYDNARFRLRASAQDFTVDDSYLVQKLKDDPYFKDKEGNFNTELWNAWVRSNQERGTNWKSIYRDYNNDLATQVFAKVTLAPAARVLDEDIDKELAARYTKLKVKYAKIEPAVTPTEDMIKAQYENNKETYREKDERQANFIAVSLQPEPNETVQKTLERAKAGEDFAALANEIAGTEDGNGGDMGWMTRPALETNPDNALFALAPGEVSEPIRVPGGFTIYKDVEERTQGAETPAEAAEGAEAEASETPAEEASVTPAAEGVREVHGRKIFIPVSLTADERAAREAQANAIFDSAKKSGVLAGATQSEGLKVKKTGWFDENSFEIEGVPTADARRFAMAVATTPKGEIADLIAASTALYIAKVTELKEGQIPPLEAVRDRVEQDTIAAMKRAPEYKERVHTEGEKIVKEATSLEDAKTKFPELNLDIQETQEFTVQESPYLSPIFLQSAQVFQAFMDKKPGDLAGPMDSLLSQTFVLELASRTEPTEEDKANWAEERKQIRDSMLQMAEQQYFNDFRLSLRSPGDVNENAKALARVLGLDQKEEEAPAAEEAPTRDAAAADAPSAESVPAEK